MVKEKKKKKPLSWKKNKCLFFFIFFFLILESWEKSQWFSLPRGAFFPFLLFLPFEIFGKVGRFLTMIFPPPFPFY